MIANDIYKKALALIDEVLPSGAIDEAKTEDYKGKAPFIIDMVQKELLYNSDLFKMFKTTLTAQTTTDWQRVELPTDLKKIDKVITDHAYNEQIYKIEREGNKQILYVVGNYEGEIKVQYRPIPTDIKTLDDTIEIDDITAQLIAYELASYFMAAEQNEFLTKLFRDKYNILKMQTIGNAPADIENIIDVYSVGGV